MIRRLFPGMTVAFVACTCATVMAQEPDGAALVDALRGGGYVIVMRHASSPRELPDAGSAAAGNAGRERQLDEEGRVTARSMGRALERLAIPIGELLSSPTFRALETARLLAIADVEAVSSLGDGGQGMKQDSEGVRSEWLREMAGEMPPTRTNRLMVTHLPNIVGAFGDSAADIADGESLIVEPEAGRAIVVARVKIEEWPTLDSD